MTRYRVETLYWTRSWNGDDWILGESSFSFSNLSEAVHKASNPYRTTKDLIETKVFDTENSKTGDLIWKKDWHENKITDYGVNNG